VVRVVGGGGVWKLAGGGGRGGGGWGGLGVAQPALLHTAAAAYLLFSSSSRLPHSIPHARAFITCPTLPLPPCPGGGGGGGACPAPPPKKEEMLGRWQLQPTVQYMVLLALVLSKWSPSMVGSSSRSSGLRLLVMALAHSLSQSQREITVEGKWCLCMYCMYLVSITDHCACSTQ
jgi:hypothetical protein